MYTHTHIHKHTPACIKCIYVYDHLSAFVLSRSIRPKNHIISFPPTLPFKPRPLSPPLLRPGNRALVFSFRPARSQIVRRFQYYK